MFLQKVAQDHLPTKVMLRGKDMDFLVIYPWCELKEIMGHALLLCLRVVQIWWLVGLSLRKSQFKIPTLAFLYFLNHNIHFEATKLAYIHATYIAYHIWLFKNNLVFNSRRCPIKFVLERALSQAIEFIHLMSSNLTTRISDIRESYSTHIATQMVFITQKPSSLTYLKINFDGSVVSNNSGACFVIHGLDSQLVVASGTHLFEPTILGWYCLCGVGFGS